MAINALMQFILASGQPIPGESQSVVDPDDDLATTGATWTPGSYFEIEDFDFSLELDEQSGVDGGGKGGGLGADGYARLKADIDDLRTEVRRNPGSPYAAPAAAKKDSDKKQDGSGRGGGRFDEYVTGKQDPAGYKPRIAPFSFKKQIDLASTTLIANCFKPTMFQSATIIKRKDTGGDGSGTAVGNLTYVRFDFLQPLITSVELSVEEVVRQSVKFVCRQVTITYAAQQMSGQTKVQTNAAVLTLNA